MHIIIPMSGTGQRFIDAGYQTPKPLIIVDGKPIIEHVCDLFPGEDKFTFICNSEHLFKTDLRRILQNIKPDAHIVEIPAHKKGPVYAVSLINNYIEDEEEVIVNYCDFGTYWDYDDFLRHTRNRGADGAIPAYKGFHPHMLGSTNYAFIKDDAQWMLQIKEKESFTDQRTREYASNGTYYFKKGAYVKKYFAKLINRGINLNGEYYVSLIYNLMFEESLNISIYTVQHMLQWGTPADLEEYKIWSKYFKHIIKQTEDYPAEKNSTTLIPLAGQGSRFAHAGYKKPKPLIDVSGKPMIIQAASYLPLSSNNIFICLKEHLDHYPLYEEIETEYPDATIIKIDDVTQGQAITCSLGLKNADKNAPLLIAATDNGMLYDKAKYQTLLDDPNIDAIVWTFRQHQSSKNNPQMYGWVKTDNDYARGVSVKKAISNDPFNDHAIVGTFYFRKVKYFTKALEHLKQKDVRVNGEFYVDSMIDELINMGLTVKIFEIDDYICWGTPDDYQTFIYWQSFFHKALWHPYSLKKDPTVNPEKMKELDVQFRDFQQEHR